jgi:hypothetical protein
MAESDVDPQILEILTRLEVIEAAVKNSEGPTSDAETVPTSGSKEDSKSNSGHNSLPSKRLQTGQKIRKQLQTRNLSLSLSLSM